MVIFIHILFIRFQIGTPEEPFMFQARIEMYGRLRAQEIPVYGTKTLAIRDGTLELHGTLKQDYVKGTNPREGWLKIIKISLASAIYRLHLIYNVRHIKCVCMCV